MKSFIVLVLLTSVFFVCSLARALNIRGFVYQDKNGYSLIDPETLTSSPILTKSRDVERELKKLANFDSLLGSGTFSEKEKSKALNLETIDFVALRRLLGFWKSADDSLVNFIDYQRVSFTVKGSRVEYCYVMTPSNGKFWRILLTDQTSVVLGSVLVENDKAEIEIYDTDTGDTTQRFNLQRVF
ncbi:MAG: hypothetical protein ACAH59_02230 [Pseudobdellovibrionaceae bacterium]